MLAAWCACLWAVSQGVSKDSTVSLAISRNATAAMSGDIGR